MFGYKQIKRYFETEFEYYDDFDIGLGVNSYYEKIQIDSTASARQQKLKEIILIII